MRTTVAIIGGGPSGLLLSYLLHQKGIDNQVLEHRSRRHVEGRVRAGQLDHASVAFLKRVGLGGRMMREGLPQRGVNIRFAGATHHVDLEAYTDGRYCTVYGQSELTKDLNAALARMGCSPIFEALNATLPTQRDGSGEVSFDLDGAAHGLTADVIVGCDGAHGPCRKAVLAEADGATKSLPFAWIGFLSETPPISHELTYVYHSRGFALWSMRSAALSRTYLQCSAKDDLDDWSDDRFWSEMECRLGDAADDIRPGRTLERVKVPMHGFVAPSVRSGNLVLAGDAAHIVPPSAAKGLNLAIADVSSLASALDALFSGRDPHALEAYEASALQRAWAAQHFSWRMTDLLHAPSEQNAFDDQLKLTQLDGLLSSADQLRPFCHRYVGAEAL
ncbi:MAG: 4-hydroxybenzoate 3-monooxygenase [Pseudomonadota bacterium]